MSNTCPECHIDLPDSSEHCPNCGLYLWDCCEDCGGELDGDHPSLCSLCEESWEENHPDEAAEQDAMIESGYADEMDSASDKDWSAWEDDDLDD